MKAIPIQPGSFCRSVDLGDLCGTECPVCDGHMEIHQPDARRPDRLLGTCEDCSIWCLIDLATDTTMILFDAAPTTLSLVRAEEDPDPGDVAIPSRKARRMRRV